MNIEDLLKDKTRKPKEKTQIISDWILKNELPIDELLAFAENSKDSVKATCIEAIEYSTKENPKISDEIVLDFVLQTLNEKAPRVIWESAKVIGNIIHLYPNKIDIAIKNLIVTTKHSGTVVRWSAAYALSEILKLRTNANKTLLPTIESIMDKEEKNSIKKIYQKAIKEVLK
ncbi:MAG: hypothetical protein P1U41_06235 [Vicingaceae bacterium]|nr:hypothetical protein [Vicingaceae bacterium]